MGRPRNAVSYKPDRKLHYPKLELKMNPAFMQSSTQKEQLAEEIIKLIQEIRIKYKSLNDKKIGEALLLARIIWVNNRRFD